MLNASDKVEFDASFLRQTGKNSIDISRFSRKNPILPGKYRLDVWVNGRFRGGLYLSFAMSQDEQKDAQLCANERLIDKIDLKKKWDNLVRDELLQSSCLSLEKQLPETRIDVNISELTLKIEIAQLLLNVRPRGYIDPARWDEGTSTIFTNYRFNHYQSKSGDQRYTNSYASFNSGINLGNWQLRHDFNLQKSRQTDWNYQASNTYLRRNLPNLSAQLMLGFFYTQSNWQENYALRGVQIASESRMLPESQQGFAPIIRDVAQSNALVQVFQQGNKIYSTSVPVGNFEISDLYPLYQSGELELRITEADGSQRRRYIDFQASAESIRAGTSRWQLALGQLRKSTYDVYPDYIFQGGLSRGINNYLSLNAGATYSKNYQNASVAVNANTSLGTLSASVKHASADLDEKNFRGENYKVGFSRKFSNNTRLSISNEWSSSPEYPRLAEVFSAHDSNNSEAVLGKVGRKNRWNVRLNQLFSSDWGKFYLNASQEKFWHSPATKTQWQIGYSNHFKKLNYQLTASQSQLESGGNTRTEKRYLLSFSLPLDGDSNHRLRARASNVDSKSSFNVGLSGNIEALDGLRYDVTGNKETFDVDLSGNSEHLDGFSYGLKGNYNRITEQSAWSADLGYATQFAELQSTYGRSEQHKQLSLGASGAVVGHSGGLTLSNTLGETFAIVKAKGAAGAQIEGASEQKIDGFGYGIAPSLSPYRKNIVGIDPRGLSLDLQIDATTKEIIPQAGSSVLVELDSRVEISRLFSIHLAGGSMAPFAAELWDEEKHNLGFVAQNGRAFARGLKDSGMIRVIWGQKKDEQCRFQYRLDTKKTKLNHLKLQPVNCL